MKFATRPHHRPSARVFRRLGEENTHMILLALIIALYLTAGAFLFSLIEKQHEDMERNVFHHELSAFKAAYCHSTILGNCSALDYLLDLRGSMSAAGISPQKTSWDFFGSFYFVSTVLTTIGKFFQV
ncbi:unnamed protein product [Soboliphyme baturini]|uniref:Ion_trans_2 domain-containing protein n=1 Tax=Soboliphyme baturini TaxID=241478 RepID=A0A183J439_9BILA|nr:unnamed protein product [Soboliphyme baturini]